MKKIYFTLIMLTAISCSFAQTVFLETFDGVGGPTAGGPGTFSFPNGWTLVNVDNRTPNAAVTYVNDAWERREDLGNVTDSAAYSTSWYTPAGASDDWMWTPAITVPANAQLKWNAKAQDAAYPDGYEVRIMAQPTNPTGSAGVLGNMVSASTQLFTTAAEASTWTAHTISLSAYAGQTVKIAYRNNSNDKFLLLIDDVEVSVNLNNDVALTTVDAISEYTLVPLAQVPVAGYPISAVVTNNGLSNASQVSLAVTVYNSVNAIVHTGNSGSTTINIGANATLTATNFLPTAADDYMVVYNLTMNPADQNQTDNRDTQYISITHSIYGRDNGNVVRALGIGAGNGGYLGQDYILNVSANINYVAGYFTGGNTTDRLAAVVWNMVAGVPSTIVASTDTFNYPTDSAGYYQLPISGGSVNLPAGRYAVTFVEFDSILQLAQTDEIFTAGRTWVTWPTNPNGAWSNNEDFGSTAFEKPYVVRPIFCEAIVPNFTLVNPTCSQTTGSATINPTGGDAPYDYLWSTGSTTNSISGVAAGAYTVSVADGIGCSVTATTTIVATNTTITATTSSVPGICTTNGSATVTPTNGTPTYTYLWSNGNTTANPTNVAAGNYNVTVTDANGCSGTASVSISVSSLTLTATTSATQSSCTNATGSVTANITNGTSPFGYQWTGGGNTSTVSNLGAGNYTVTVSDVNGCTGTAIATVGTPNGPSASASQTNVLCAGGTNGAVNLTVTGGTAPITTSWSSGQTTEDISGLAAGSYTVTVNDVNNCSFVSTATVTEPATLSFTGSVTNASTSGSSDGSITLNITGGTGAYTTSPSSLTGLAPGNYNVTVTDANGCTSNQSFTVSFGSGVNNISSINSVHVYPNPTSGQLFVDVTLKDASDLNVSIFSVTGALVYNGKFNHILAQVINIPTYNLASGVYTLQVTAPGETKTNKVVVQH